VGALHAQEAIVYAISRNPDNLARLKQDFPNIHTTPVDLSNWDETRKAVESLGPIDHLINNAGVAFEEPFLAVSEKHFDA
jgi:L-xylulose reductase